MNCQLNEQNNKYVATVNGNSVECERVTKVIKDSHPSPIGLIKWQINLGWEASKAKMEEAGKIGSEAHHAVETYLKQRTVKENLSPEAATAFKGFLSFLDTCNIYPIALEFSIFDLDHKVAGTVDFVGTLNDELWIMDWKTSGAIYEDHLVQISAYKYMLDKYVKNNPDEELSKSILTVSPDLKFRMGILQLKKDPAVNYRKPFKLEEVSEEDSSNYIEQFKLMCRLHELRHNVSGKTKGV